MTSPVDSPEAALAACAGGSVEHSLGWALATVMRVYSHAAAVDLQGLPGGPRGYHLLSAAAHEEPRTQQDLGRRVGVDRSVMTYLVDDLITAGYVERVPDPADRRARRVVITDTGRERLTLIEERLGRVDDHVLRDLTPEQRTTFRALLRQIAISAPGEPDCS
jgi:DNA-binding MarR family transcriptional regulator